MLLIALSFRYSSTLAKAFKFCVDSQQDNLCDREAEAEPHREVVN